jgi:uroporphyrin-III C-methyltransferase/precorrin-2 dehydrogenase/sirohydrochlorin ferrochelatase
MPVRTLAALVTRALAEGLDPQTPAAAIARATRPDQQVIAAPIAELPARLKEAALPGPVLVLLGQIVGEHRGAPAAEPCALRAMPAAVMAGD